MVAAASASPSTAAGWRGEVFVGSGWLLYSGAVGSASLHAHHAVQLILARGGLAEVESSQGHACRGLAVGVGADTGHAMHCAIPAAFLLYLEPGSRVARRVCGPPSGSTIRALAPDAPGMKELLSEPDPGSLEHARVIARRMVALLASHQLQGPQRAPHPSVRRALSQLPDLIARHGSELRLPVIAAAVGRSPEGFSRTFNEEIGMSVPAYLRWARLRVVARSLAHGQTLTAAAQDAGFSDSAHLSRVFRRTFGIRPSDLTCANWTVGSVELD